MFFSLKNKFIKEEVNKILEIFGISLLIKAMEEVLVKVEVVAILINKIFKAILPIIMHNQEEAGISVK
jgi:ssDNA-binding replication factor A large subunit